MDEDWRNEFGILMCAEIYDGAGAGICDGAPSICFSFVCVGVLRPIDNFRSFRCCQLLSSSLLYCIKKRYASRVMIILLNTSNV